MKYFKQFIVIIVISFLGELLHEILPIPIPASIYGLVLMLFALITKTVRLDMVEGASGFLIDVMPIMFVPAAASLLTRLEDMKALLIPVLLAGILGTLVTMGITGVVTQIIIRRHGK